MKTSDCNVLAKGILAAAVSLVTAQVLCADVILKGHFGARFDRLVRNHVAAMDACQLADFFGRRTDDWWWRTEFWGKYMHAAAPFAAMTACPQLRSKVDASVDRLLALQDADGYLGDQCEETRCKDNWDLWGVKYTMLGLLHHYDLTKSEKSLSACCRLCDWVMSVFGEGKRDLRSATVYGGLPGCSILEPVVWLYNRTRERKYLDYASYVVREMTEKADGPDLLVQAKVPVADRRYRVFPSWHKFPPKPEFSLTKAYEQMSCYQGLLEYYEVTGRRDLLEAAVATAESIRRDEINLVGAGAAGEHWYHGRENQTKLYSSMQETCVVTTWMRLCEKLLALTGDPKWADEIERTFHNAYLAALSPEGDVFAMYTPLAGYRTVGTHHCSLHHNCCNANGPRGYLSYLRSFVRASARTLYLDQYASGTVEVAVPDLGEKVGFDVYTRYPRAKQVSLWYRGREPREFTLALRIPAFSTNTVIDVNRTPVADLAKAGTYAKLTRLWKGTDRIDVTFDMPVVMHRLADHVAFTRGPVALARDSRFGDGDIDEGVQADYVNPAKIAAADVSRVDDLDMFLSVTLELPLGSHVEDSDNGLPSAVHFTDFASAGNRWNPKNRYRVWLPSVLPGRVY